MGIFKFSLSMLKKDYKKSLIYGLTLTFAVTVIFLFLNIITNTLLFDNTDKALQGGSTFATMEVPFSSGLSLLIIFFCCGMMFFANNFYLSRKTDEIAILRLSGTGAISCTMYLVYQTLMIMLVALPLGLLLGHFSGQYYNQLVFDSMDIIGNPAVPSIVYIYTIGVVLCIVATMSVLCNGYIYKNDIQSLLSSQTEMNMSEKSNVKMKSILFGLMFVFSLYSMFLAKHSPTSYIVPIFIGVCAIYGLIRYSIPTFIRFIKSKYILTKRYSLIYVSNLSYSLTRSQTLFFLMILSVTCMICTVASNQDNGREFISSIMSYIVIIILLITSIVYKYSMEAQTRSTLFTNLWKIGYTKKELKKIIFKEVLCYYALLILLPMFFSIFVEGRFIYYNDMTVSFALILDLMYIVPVIVSMIITYRLYHNAVITPIKEDR